MRPTNETRTRAVLDRVLTERRAQEARYGEANELLLDGTGYDTRWLLPLTKASAENIQQDLRSDYEAFEQETGNPTWMHLVREEIAEAFQESDPDRLAEELIQVAALCVSWVERLDICLHIICEECGDDEGPHQVDGRNLCSDCLNAEVPGWHCGKVGCKVVGTHEHAGGVASPS